MTGQEALFYSDFRGSVKHLVALLGGAKVVGALLRPTWSVERSTGWVNDCLSIKRDSKFDFEDLAALLKAAREAHIHCAMWQLCDDAGYAHPDIATPLTEEQRLAARRRKWAEEGQRIADEEAALERQKGIGEVRALSAAARRGGS